MSKYSSHHKQEEIPRNTIHPVWRGIGFLIIVITPIISWAAASLLLKFGFTQGWPFIYELPSQITFPDIVYTIPVISLLANFITSIPNLPVMLLFFVLMLIIFSSIFAVLNAVIYRFVGPPRYTRIDSPAPRVKTKRYTR